MRVKTRLTKSQQQSQRISVVSTNRSRCLVLPQQSDRTPFQGTIEFELLLVKNRVNHPRRFTRQSLEDLYSVDFRRLRTTQENCFEKSLEFTHRVVSYITLFEAEDEGVMKRFPVGIRADPEKLDLGIDLLHAILHGRAAQGPAVYALKGTHGLGG